MMKKGDQITLEYSLSYDDANGELIEKTSSEEPLQFVFGEGEMLDSFENKLSAVGQGGEFSFSLIPEEAYGQVQEELLVEYPKEQFMVEGELDEDFLQPGEIIEMTDSEGNVFEGLIEENKLNSILVDFNHPLSGETLHFKGTVVKIS